MWREIWDQIGPRTELVLSRGESTFDERLLLMMDRYGYLEETYFTFSYSPQPDDEGGIGGLFCAVTEETDRVIGERRLRLLRTLTSKTQDARTPDAVCKLAAESLKEADRDLPFAMIYLHDPDKNILRLAARVGIAPSHPAAQDSIELVPGAAWCVDEVMADGNAKVLDELSERIPRLPTGAWNIPPQKAFVMRINPEAARINGKPASAFLGRTHWEEWPASVGTEIEREYRRAVTESTPVHFKHHYVDETHDVFLDIHAYPTEDGLTVYYRDVTEKEAALMQNEKLAAMGRLAASIAHEINNPLEAVTNLLYLIDTSAVREEVKNYTRMAEEELKRVAQIATQTLRFHRQSSAPSEAMMSRILESILVLYQGRFANSGIQVERKLRDTRPVLCLEGEVRQTLTNVIANAVDAMPCGGRLLIRTKEVHNFVAGRAGVVVTIADTGEGISLAVQKRLFEAFFTARWQDPRKNIL